MKRFNSAYDKTMQLTIDRIDRFDKLDFKSISKLLRWSLFSSILLKLWTSEAATGNFPARFLVKKSNLQSSDFLTRNRPEKLPVAASEVQEFHKISFHLLSLHVISFSFHLISFSFHFISFHVISFHFISFDFI